MRKITEIGMKDDYERSYSIKIDSSLLTRFTVPWFLHQTLLKFFDTSLQYF